MKKLIYLFAAGSLFFACGEAKKTAEETKDVAEASTEAVTYAVNTETSSVKWVGAKITETVHNGTVKISEGSLSVKDGNIEAGNFTIDMNTIADADLTEETGMSKLVGHLKSPDFFMVDSFPTAKFEISSVEKTEGAEGTHKVSGNLTIKGVTNGITFPATVTMTENGIDAMATIVINRNEWGIVWGGTQTEQSVKDYLKNNLIKDEIEFQVNLKASK